MKIINWGVGLHADDFVKDRRTVWVDYRLRGMRKLQRYIYTFPMDVLRDIGARELGERILSVFKQHIKRK